MIHVPQEGEQFQAETPKKKPHRRFYTDRERADALAALEANGGNVWATAKNLGIPHATLNQWSGGSATRAAVAVIQRPEVAQVNQESKRDLLKALEHARWLYLDRLTDPDAVAKTSGYYAAVTTKILTEQHQLLSGGATSRAELSLASFLGSVTTEALPAGGEKTNP